MIMDACRLPARLIASLVALVGSAMPCAAYARVEAYAARPFGVGRISVSVPAAEADSFDTGAFALVERDDRAIYPVFSGRRASDFVRNVLGVDFSSGASQLTVSFLFVGDGPLDVTLYTPTARRFSITPQHPDGAGERTARRIQRARDRLYGHWWREYNANALAEKKRGDYPPLVHTYLTTMLSTRLGLEWPIATRREIEKERLTPPQESRDLLLGTEAMRAAVMRESLLGDPAYRQPATLPVPRQIPWTPLTVPETDGSVEIEPIAMHVPIDCFYVRFGRFNNYVWLNHLQDDYGGDIARMVTLRAQNPGLNDRMERQLGLKQSALAEMFGEQAIADVALIGRDMFTREGAAVGVLFQARNNVLLGNDLKKQQSAAMAERKGNAPTREIVKIAGHDVSFVSTPDNRLRSFYAVDGDFHLVTTSRAVVKAFYDAGAGRGSLGRSAEFRYARSLMPNDRKDTIFVYMSPAFFQGLLSPQYRIELRRRLQAATDIELIQMAQLAARAEKKPGETIEDLVAGGFLPRGFDRRADGSGPIIEENRVIDSLRGARGTFTPVPDIPLRAVTSTEARGYAEVVTFHRTQWQQMDPLLIGVKRYKLNDTGLERIVIDGWVSPFVGKKYGWIASMVGPPLKNRVAPVPGDVISVQTVVKGGLLLPSVGVHHLYLGVQDTDPVGDISQGGLLTAIRLARTTPSYYGGWPKPGYLDRLPLGLAPRSDELGYARLLFGLWRREWNGFSTLSFHQPLLAWVTPRLKIEEADTPAQVRIDVGDLSKARITGMSNAIAYQRAKQASAGNVRMLHMLSQQLRVPRKDALGTAEALVDAKLVCTLGGEYRLARHDGGLEQWVSSQWDIERSTTDYKIPKEYGSPVLQWFRGMTAELIMEEDELLAHVQLDMQRKKRDKPKIALPLFDLFGGAKKPKKAKKPELEEIKKPKEDPKEEAREF